MNFLYAVEEKEYPAVKIGYASGKEKPSGVQSRLQQGNPRRLCKITVLRKYRRGEEAKAIESCVHNVLGGKGGGGPLSIWGEWYEPEVLALLPEILDDCEERNGIRPI